MFASLFRRFLYNLVYTSFFLYSGYGDNLYLSFALAAVAEVPASIITMLLLEKVGRRKLIMPLTLIAGISCLMIAFLSKYTVQCALSYCPIKGCHD